MAPALGVGVGVLVGRGVGDLDGEGLVLVGDGVGDLEGVALRDGLGTVGLLGLLLGVWLFVGLGEVGVGVCEAVAVPVGLGAADVVGSPVGPALKVGVALAIDRGADSGSASANWVAACEEGTPPDPHRLLRLLSGLAGVAYAGAIAGPDNRNSPAPATAAACPTRTTLTGTPALR